MVDQSRSAEPSLFVTGMRCRCPRCGNGALFSGYLQVAERCEACDLDYGFADSGDGPAVFIILIAGLVIVAAAMAVEIIYQPPYWVHAVIWIPASFILCLAMLRPLKSLMLALQYKHKAAEGRLAAP